MRLRLWTLMAGRRVVIAASRAAWSVLGAMLISCAFLATPADTSANTGCTDTWTGGAGNGLWQTAGNWSTGSVPGAGDVACVGAGVTVSVTAGTNQAGVLQDEGGLSVSGGSLELASTSETSTVGSLSLVGGTLSVAGELDVSSSLAVTGNPVTVSGAGRLVVESGATGTIGSTGCTVHPALSGVTLVNKGSLTFGASAGVGAGAVAMQNGAQFKNEGTFTDRSYDEGCGYGVGGSSYSFYNTGGSASIVNTGTFQAEGASRTLNIDVAFTNEGTVKALSGALRFIAGGSGASSTWSAASSSTLSFGAGSYTLSSDTFSGAGTVNIAGASVTATKLQASGSNVALGSGTLTIPEGSSTTANGLILTGGTLSVSGELAASGSFSATGTPTISGSGKLVVQYGVSGTIGTTAECSIHLVLSGATLVNQGTLNFGGSAGVGAGAIAMQNGAQFLNEGTFNNDSYDSGCGYGVGGSNYSFYNTGGTTSITNTGTFNGGAGGVTLNVAVAFENLGVVSGKTGTLRFTAGGIPGQVATGRWSVQSGAAVVLAGGEFLIAEAVNLSAVRIEGATVKRVQVSGAPKGSLNELLYAAGTVTVSGSGESVGSGFSSASIEASPAGVNEWKALCGPLTPGLMGIFSCSWSTTTGLTPDGSYRLRAQLSDSSSPPNTAPTPAITVLVDNTPPSGSVSTPSDLHGPQTVSGSASDSGSGVASWQLQIAAEGSGEWRNACPKQESPSSGSTYQCTVEGFSYQDGVYQLRAVIADKAGNTTTSTPASTTVDNAPPANTAAPTISGRAWAGQWLKASSGQWAGTEPFTYAYQWQRCNSAGESCANISGATSASYPVSRSDLGSTLRVVVTASNQLGSASSTSEATAVVVESSCTDNWTGASGGSWQTASNWSTGAVPGASDIACISSGITVQVSGGANQTGSLRAQGNLTISGGSLELASELESSSVGSLTLTGGTLTLADELDLTGALAVTGANHPTIAGAGSLVIKPGATGALDSQACGSGGGDIFINKAALVNQGTLTFGVAGGGPNGDLAMSNGAQIQNSGTFNADSWSNNVGSCNYTNNTFYNAGGVTAPSITNTGTLNVDVGAGHTALANVTVNNQGTVETKTGTLQLAAGGSDSKGTWNPASGTTISFTGGAYTLSGDTFSGAGTINVAGGVVTATGLQAGSANLTLSSGSLTVPSGSTAPVANLTLTGGTLTVSGELDVSNSFTGAGGGRPTINGAGSFVLKPAATGTIDSQACGSGGGDFLLSSVTLVNQGTLTFGVAGGGPDGDLMMSNGAQIQNSGTFNADSWSNNVGSCNNINYSFYNYGGTAPSITNTGTFNVNAGSEHVVLSNVAFDNQGATTGVSGMLQLTGGGADSKGSWSPASGATISFAGGAYTLSGDTLSGPGTVGIAGASVTATGLKAGGANLSVTSGSLTLPDEAARTVGSLTVKGSATTLKLAGELTTTSSLTLGSGDTTLNGGGRLVLASGGSGTITPSECSRLTLNAVTLINNGTLTMGSAPGASDQLNLEAGAELENAGTFNADAHTASCVPGADQAAIYNNGGASPSFTNAGTLNVNPGSANTVLLMAPFSNSGSVDVQSGTFTPTAGTAGGTWKTEGATTVAFTAATSFSLSKAEASQATFSVSGSGTLGVAGGASTIGTLNLSGGTLSLTGELDISGSLTGAGSGHPTVSGSGSLVVKPAASAAIDSQACGGGGGGDFFLSSVTLVNQGTLTFGVAGGGPNGDLVMSNGAQIQNAGTFNADSWSNDVGSCNYTNYSFYNYGGTAPSITNTGTFNVNGGSGHTILSNVAFGNQGTVNVQSGTLAPTTGTAGGTWKTEGSGTVGFTGATSFSLSKAEASQATFSLSGSGTFGVASGTSTIGTLNLSGGTLGVTGELDISGSLTGTGSGQPTISGAGSVVIKPEATGTIDSQTCGSGGGDFHLSEAALVNQGTLTLGVAGGGANGDIVMSNGARLQNNSMLHLDSWSNDVGACNYTNYSFANGGGTIAPGITNTGTLSVDVGSGHTALVGVPFNNQGTVSVQSGTATFNGGGVAEKVATGAWRGVSGTSILLSGGTFMLEEGSEFFAQVNGATVVWISAALSGGLQPLPYAAGTATVSGHGERGAGGPFASATVEATPKGTGEWQPVCGPVSAELSGAFGCAWNTASGSYPDGRYELRAHLSSQSGEEAALTPAIQTLVDNTPPAGSVSAPSGALAGYPTITGAGSDGGSGVASWQLQIAAEGSSEWSSACAAQTAPISGGTYGCVVETYKHTDGSYQLRAVITDNAGNTYTTTSVGLQIANAAVKGSLTAPAAYIGKTVTLSGTGSATGSTVESWAVQIAPAGSSSWSSACPAQSTPVSGSEYRCTMNTTEFADGSYQLRAVVRDAAGATYTGASAVSSLIDNTPPVGAVYAPPEKVAGKIEVAGYAFDAGSGVAGWTLEVAPVGSEAFKEACVPLSQRTLGMEYACSVDTTQLADGSYQFRARIVDNLGNTYTTPTVATSVENHLPLALLVAPTVSGEAFAGEALSASTGSWRGGGTITYAYQWQRCNTSGEACANIEGATGTGYVLGAGDVGSTLRIVVTATNDLETISASSAPTAVVQANTLADASAPTVSGSPQTGASLDANPGAWRGERPIAYAYQWLRCNTAGEACANIEGATSQTYTPVQADVSSTLRVSVTATNSEGSASARSQATGQVTAGAASGIRYLYDEAGRLRIIDDPSQGAAVYSYDANGNLTAIERYSQSTVSVLALTPSHAPPGAQVDITGTGFSSEASKDQVSFNGTPASVSKASVTDLIVTVPEGATAGKVSVTVGESSGSSQGSFIPHASLRVGAKPTPPPISTLPVLAQASAGSASSGPLQSFAGANGSPAKTTGAFLTRRHAVGGRSRRHARAHRHAGCKHRGQGARGGHRRCLSVPAHRARRGRTHARTAREHTSEAGSSGQPAPVTPASLAGYRTPYPSSWTPQARNRIGGDWVTGRAASPWTRLPALTPSRTTTGLSGQALEVGGAPLANVTLTVQGTGQSTRTDRTGRFLLSGLPAGHQVLVIDGETADGHGRRFGQFSVGVELAAGKVTPLGYTIWMTPLEAAGDTSIASPLPTQTTITNPNIPGLEVRMPAGTVIHDANGKIVRHLNLTAIPVDRPPFPLPFVTGIPTYFTVQPGRSYLSKGAQIIYPNWGHLPPGQRVDFWNYDPTDRGWYIYGQGTVSKDGKQVVPDPNVRIWEFTGAMISSTNAPPSSAPRNGDSITNGDPVDLATGLFLYRHSDLSLPDSAMPIALSRVYRPGDNNSYSFGIGTQSPFDLHLWSQENYKTAYLVLPEGGKIKFVRTSAGTGFTEAVYAATETAGAWDGAVLQWDTAEGGWELRRRDGMKFFFPDYDPVRAIEDRNGNRITLVRQGGGAGPVTEIRGPHNHAIYLSYDNYNRIVSAGDNAGQTVKYEYDSSGRLVRFTDAMGRVTRYNYNSANDIVSVVGPRGNVQIENTYDSENRVLTQTVGKEGTYEFSYSGWRGGWSGRYEYVNPSPTTTVVNPDGHRRKLTFDLALPVVDQEEVEAESRASERHIVRTTYGHESDGVIASVSRPEGTVSIGHDHLGNVTSVAWEPTSNPKIATRVAYSESYSEPLSVTDQLGRTTSYSYDSKGNLTGITDPMGRRTSLAYDTTGEPVSVTNATGDTTRLGYENGLISSITDPLGHTASYGYDAAGDLTAITDPEGRLSRFVYNPDGELTSETDPAGKTTSYGYDADGNLVSLTDPRGHTQSGTYDNRDQLTSWTDSLNRTTRYAYDHAGLLESVTDPKGQTTSYEYDILGRLAKASFGSVEGGAPASSISYGYDERGNLASATDSRGGAYTLSYDPYNRLKRETGPNGSVEYSYDATGQRQSASLDGETLASYAHNLDGQLTGISTPNGSVAIAYDQDGRRTRTVLPNGDSESYTYNQASQLAGISYQHPAGEAIGDLQYARDALGRVSAISGSLARTSLPAAVTEASYDAANELTKLNGQTLTYDADGNLTGEGATSYTWNDRNQLTGVSKGEESSSYSYDPFGRRASKTIAGKQTGYLYDGENVAAELTSGAISATITNGLGLDSIYARTTSAGTTSYLKDQQGSVLALAGANGATSAQYTYSPSGAATVSGEAGGNPYQYTGLQAEPNGLQYNRARYYQPSTGRFISQDPAGLAGSGVNLYAYAGDNPLNFIDPTGYKSSLIEGLEEAGEGVTGVVESATGGLPGLIRKGLGINEPDFSSAGFQIGADAGIFAAAIIPGDEEVAVADIAKTGATDLSEQLTLEEAQAGAGQRIMQGKINDPQYPEDVWAKMQHVHQNPNGTNTVIHYWENLETGDREGFKFK